jgi:TPP-dependent pyruvate/acetoin dehydrogenase alpha subunit
MQLPRVTRTRAVGSAVPGRFDARRAYRLMVRMRLVEESLVRAWHDGLVPGEYHSGVGEEGINAGVLMHLSGRDSMALDHRNTGPLVGRGADPRSLMLEVLGSEEGVNRGRAGHMHVLVPDLNAGSDGIVGSSGPLAAGQALAHTQRDAGRVAIAFHGEGAMNAGMLMESYNLAVAWNLPVVFVCKDNRWSITTYSAQVTGGDLLERASAFGLAVEAAAGDRVEDVHAAAGRLIARARRRGGPGFLHVTCHRPGGHFEGDPLVRILRDPRGQARELAPGVAAGATSRDGGSPRDRAGALSGLSARGGRAARDWAVRRRMDPVRSGRQLIDAEEAARIEDDQAQQIREAIDAARTLLGSRPSFGRGARDSR